MIRLASKRGRRRVCARWCPPLEEAFDAILDWRHLRMLRSRATHLRLREELVELEQRIARPGRLEVVAA